MEGPPQGRRRPEGGYRPARVRPGGSQDRLQARGDQAVPGAPAPGDRGRGGQPPAPDPGAASGGAQRGAGEAEEGASAAPPPAPRSSRAAWSGATRAAGAPPAGAAAAPSQPAPQLQNLTPEQLAELQRRAGSGGATGRAQAGAGLPGRGMMRVVDGRANAARKAAAEAAASSRVVRVLPRRGSGAPRRAARPAGSAPAPARQPARPRPSRAPGATTLPLRQRKKFKKCHGSEPAPWSRHRPERPTRGTAAGPVRALGLMVLRATYDLAWFTLIALGSPWWLWRSAGSRGFRRMVAERLCLRLRGSRRRLQGPRPHPRGLRRRGQGEPVPRRRPPSAPRRGGRRLDGLRPAGRT